MACTIRCRRSRSPKGSCRCSCGGSQHGAEAAGRFATGGGSGSGRGDGDPGHPSRDPLGPQAMLSGVLEAGHLLRPAVAQAGAPFERAVRVQAARVRRLSEALGAESDGDRLDKIEMLYDRSYDRLVRARDARARARIGALLTALGGVREMGGNSQPIADGSSPELARIVASRGLLSCFPSDWVEASEAKGPFLVLEDEDVDLSRYRPAHEFDDERGRLFLGPAPTDDPPERWALHEMCHRMEDSVPEIVAMEREYHKRRVPAAWDQQGNPKPGMHAETAEPRAAPPFFDNYCERRWPAQEPEQEGYELLSMGYEHLLFGPRLFTLNRDAPERFTGKDTSFDPEYESFVLGLLATAGKPSGAEERGPGGRR